MFNMHKVSLDTIKYWLVELYVIFFTGSYSVVAGKILRSTITAHKGLVEKFKNYCERVIFLHILPDAYNVRNEHNIYSHPQMKKLRQKHIGINSVLESHI